MIAGASRIAFCVWLVLAGTFSALAQTYAITEIGVLKGDNESSGFRLNSAGQVVGCSDTASNGYPCTGLTAGQHAFLWSKSAGLKDLGTLPGGTISGATGINDDGQVVGYSNVKAGSASDSFAFLWTPTEGMTDLGTLSGGHSSGAFEINSAGVIAGDSDSIISNGHVIGASWTNNVIRNLGGLPKSIFTQALDINDNNQIVGESTFTNGPPFRSHAFEWSAALGMKDLGTLRGGTTSMANAINYSGVIVGQSNSGAFKDWHAVMWNAARKIRDLGILPGGTYSFAFGINDSDEVVGSGDISKMTEHAFLWTQAAGMRDLNSLIPANSGWVLINAYAINRLGQITGYGTFKGYNHGFLLSPK
jgi:probable HAF family extracellular repeat protein